MALGVSSTLLLGSAGQLWRLMINESGQNLERVLITRSHVEDGLSGPAAQPLLNAVEVACGDDHVVVKLKDGEVVVWGNGCTQGQLGLGTDETGGVVSEVVAPRRLHLEVQEDSGTGSRSG